MLWAYPAGGREPTDQNHRPIEMSKHLWGYRRDASIRANSVMERVSTILDGKECVSNPWSAIRCLQKWVAAFDEDDERRRVRRSWFIEHPFTCFVLCSGPRRFFLKERACYAGRRRLHDEIGGACTAVVGGLRDWRLSAKYPVAVASSIIIILRRWLYSIPRNQYKFQY